MTSRAVQPPGVSRSYSHESGRPASSSWSTRGVRSRSAIDSSSGGRLCTTLMGRGGRDPRFQEKVIDEIVTRVKQRAGIDEGQARPALDTVLSFFKDRRPEP